jgi:hypothetical protein
LLPKLRQATEATILLVDKLIEQSRTELSERTLNVPAAQSTRGRCLLQHGFLALPSQSLKDWALLLHLDELSLRLWPSQPKRSLHLLQRRNASLRVGLEKPTKLFTGRTGFSSTSFRSLHLLLPCFLGGLRTNGGRADRRTGHNSASYWIRHC